MKSGKLHLWIQSSAIVLQTLIAALMLYSLSLSREAVKVADRQFRASVEPDLRFLPKSASMSLSSNNMAREFVQTEKPGVFNFVIKNAGVDDLDDIDINED